MKIWCLFSVANNYDQPPNNLVAWWVEKPSMKMMAEALNLDMKCDGAQDLIFKMVNSQETPQIRGVDYWVEQIEEGVL